MLLKQEGIDRVKSKFPGQTLLSGYTMDLQFIQPKMKIFQVHRWDEHPGCNYKIDLPQKLDNTIITSRRGTFFEISALMGSGLEELKDGNLQKLMVNVVNGPFTSSRISATGNYFKRLSMLLEEQLNCQKRRSRWSSWHLNSGKPSSSGEITGEPCPEERFSTISLTDSVLAIRAILQMRP
jgi:hypothetical protein